MSYDINGGTYTRIVSGSTTGETFLEINREDKKLAISNILHINSCCISYTNLAMGRTDALIVSTNKPWDVMPGEFLCKELGLPINSLEDLIKESNTSLLVGVVAL